jgi:plastocyanin
MKWLTVAIGVALLSSCLAQGNAQTQKKTSNATIKIWDACDPDTFNAAFGSGTCIPGHHGQTVLNDFVGELQTDHIAGGWRFDPLLDASAGTFKLVKVELAPGDHTAIVNNGGETHTFTRVKEFGGGFVDFLNGLTGNPVPAPECAQVLRDGTLVPQPESDSNIFVEAGETEPGPTAGSSVLPNGASRWECCIHPWMRMTVVVKKHEHEHEHED